MRSQEESRVGSARENRKKEVLEKVAGGNRRKRSREETTRGNRERGRKSQVESWEGRAGGKRWREALEKSVVARRIPGGKRKKNRGKGSLEKIAGEKCEGIERGNREIMGGNRGREALEESQGESRVGSAG